MRAYAVPNTCNRSDGGATGVASRVRGTADIGILQRAGFDPVALAFHGQHTCAAVVHRIGPREDGHVLKRASGQEVSDTVDVNACGI